MNIVNFNDTGIFEYKDTRDNYIDNVRHGMVLSEIFGWKAGNDSIPEYDKIGYLMGLSYLKKEIETKDIAKEQLQMLSLDKGEQPSEGEWHSSPIVFRDIDDDKNITFLQNKDYKIPYKKESKVFYKSFQMVNGKLKTTMKEKSEEINAIETAHTTADAPKHQAMIFTNDSTLAQVGPISLLNDSKSSMQTVDEKGDVAFLRNSLAMGNPNYYQDSKKPIFYDKKGKEIKAQNKDNLQTAIEFGESPDGEGLGLVKYDNDKWAVLSHNTIPLTSAEKSQLQKNKKNINKISQKSKALAEKIQKAINNGIKQSDPYLKRMHSDLNELALQNAKEQQSLQDLQKKGNAKTLSPLSFGFNCGNSKHWYKKNPNLHYAHLTTGSLFINQSGSRDGSLKFTENDYEPGGKKGITKEAEIRFDSRTEQWRVNYWDEIGRFPVEEDKESPTTKFPPTLTPPTTGTPSHPVGRKPGGGNIDNIGGKGWIHDVPINNEKLLKQRVRPVGSSGSGNTVLVGMPWNPPEIETPNGNLPANSRDNIPQYTKKNKNKNSNPTGSNLPLSISDEHTPVTVTPPITFPTVPHQGGDSVGGSPEGQKPQIVTNGWKPSPSRDTSSPGEKNLQTPNNRTKPRRIGKGSMVLPTGRSAETDVEVAVPSLEIKGSDTVNQPSPTANSFTPDVYGGLSYKDVRLSTETFPHSSTENFIANPTKNNRGYKHRVERLKQNQTPHYIKTSQGYALANADGKILLEKDSKSSMYVPETTGVVWNSPANCKVQDVDRFYESGYSVVDLHHKTRSGIAFGLPNEGTLDWRYINFDAVQDGLNVDVTKIDFTKLQTVAIGIEPVGLVKGSLYLEETDSWGGGLRKGYNLKVYYI